MPSNGKCIVFYPNRTLEAPTVTSENDATEADDNILTERIDTWWEPVNVDSPRWIQLTWPSAITLSGIAVPHLEVTSTDPELLTMQVEAGNGSLAVVSADALYQIKGTGGATARNEQAQPNLGLETEDFPKIQAAGRFASYRTWTPALADRVRVTFTRGDAATSTTLRVPHLVVGYAWQDPDTAATPNVGASHGMAGSWTRGEVVLEDGTIRRTLDCNFPWLHQQDFGSRWYRQSLLGGAAQKWAVVVTPDSSQDHTFYDGGFIWGYRQPLRAQRRPSKDATTNRFSVDLSIRESLNGEFRPGA